MAYRSGSGPLPMGQRVARPTPGWLPPGWRLSRWPIPAGSAARSWLEWRGSGEDVWMWSTMVWILLAPCRLPHGGIRACGGDADHDGAVGAGIRQRAAAAAGRGQADAGGAGGGRGSEPAVDQ